MRTAPRLVTEAEFLTLPESLDHIELVDGEVILAPRPSFWHQDIVLRIASALRAWATQTTGYQVCVSPLDVRFGPNRILQPDVFVVGGRIPATHEGPIDRIPMVCIEVLSSNRAYDRITKRFIYAQAGVVEYWIVSAAALIERWSGEGLEHSEEVTTTLQNTVLPGFELSVASLFQAE